MPWTVPAGHRLGFFYELVATLCLPLTTFVIIMLMALLIYGWELQTNRNRRWPFETHTRCAIALTSARRHVPRACSHCAAKR